MKKYNGFFSDDDPARESLDIIYRTVLSTRAVWLQGEVTEVTAFQIVTELLYLEKLDPKLPAILYINSPGGKVYDGLSILDCMRHVSMPVYTHCMGHAMSMGAILLACGEPGHRYASPNSSIMIHQVSGGAFGDTDNLEVNVQEQKRLQKLLLKELARVSNKNLARIRKDCRVDYFLSAKDAKTYGLIDKVK